MKRLIPLFICLALNCYFFKPNKKQDNSLDALIGLGIVLSIPDAYARLFYLNPLFLENTNNLDLLQDFSNSKGLNSKKIILVHGWNTSDPQNPAYPSDLIVKNRIKTQWEHLISSDNAFLKSLQLKNYDVYLFTYLTSGSIENNGFRLRNRLDLAFSGQSVNVYIFAHSMGGLVSRIALYQGDKPLYLLKLITSGTPFHGSPFASSVFQSNKDGIGDISSFMTNTEGGRGLAWDNFDNSLSGASNQILSYYNSNTSRDSIITKYYGSIPSTGNGYIGTLLPGCIALGSIYSPSDCVVPQSSAILNGLTGAVNIGAYDHVELNLRVQAVKNQLNSDLP